MGKRTIVIIPAFNEAKTIERVCRAVKNVDRGYFVLVVNDASTDQTAEIASKSANLVINQPLNLGIGGNMQTGYRYAMEEDFDYAIQVDGDGQHLPAEIPKLFAAMDKSGADMAIGSRFLGRNGYNQPFMRRLGVNIFSVITQLLIGQSIKDSTSGFRLVNKEVIAVFAESYPSDYPEPEVLVSLNKRGFKIAETSVRMEHRESGKSSINALKSAYYMLKVGLAMIIVKVRRREDV